ncbi:MAG: hypothetical protein DRI36_04330 [Caldiserica bacterium]|nr:MAG: hypothetical protein DRI36_04330 [Caldisericota bacterium]
MSRILWLCGKNDIGGFSRGGFTSEDMLLSTPPDSRRAGLPAGRQAQDVERATLASVPRGESHLYNKIYKEGKCRKED